NRVRAPVRARRTRAPQSLVARGVDARGSRRAAVRGGRSACLFRAPRAPARHPRRIRTRQPPRTPRSRAAAHPGGCGPLRGGGRPTEDAMIEDDFIVEPASWEADREELCAVREQVF